MGVLEVKEPASVVEGTEDPPPAFGGSTVFLSTERVSDVTYQAGAKKKVAGSRKGARRC